jgi:HEAT repeat protein
MKYKKLRILFFLICLLLISNLVFAQKREPDEEIFLKAKTALYQKEWPEAIRNLERLISEFPRSPYLDNALYWLGYSLYRLSETGAEKEREVALKKEALNRLEQLLRQFNSSSWRNEARLLEIEIAQKLVQSGYPEFKKYIEATITGVGGVKGGEEGVKGIKEGVVGVEGGVEHGVEGTVAGLSVIIPPPSPPLSLNEKETDPELEIKLIALNALMSLEKNRAWPVLERVARENPSPRLRSQALFILSQYDDPRVIPLLLERASSDPDHQVRESAIFWLGQHKGEETVEALSKIFDQAKDLALKEKVLFALALNKNPKALNKLISIARENPDLKIKQRAIFWLGQSRERMAEEALFEMYDETKEENIKENLLFAFSQSATKPAIRKLIDIARREQNLKLKKTAIFYLALTNDEEALAFLKEIIEKGIGQNESQADGIQAGGRSS